MTIREEIEAVVRTALAEEYPALAGLRFEVLKPRERAFGDLATNVAMLAAKDLGTNPIAVAERLAARLRGAPGVTSVEVAKPGFINISVAVDLYLARLRQMVDCGDDEALGASSAGERKLVQVEFVSANPTGPLNVVSARAAAVGDSLVRLLKRTGHDARSEFYINDSGTQFELLGRSLEARFREILGESAEIPENGYPGEYLVAIASRVKELADWADGQAASAASPEESAPGSERELVGRFLGEREAGGRSSDGARAGDVEAWLKHYVDFALGLPQDRRVFWAPLYVCELSSRHVGLEEITSRLAWVEAYRAFLAGAAGKQAPGARDHGREGRAAAAEVFLGGAVTGRRFDFARFAVEMIVEGQRSSLRRFGNRPEGGLEFDCWKRESTLRDLVGEVMKSLVDDGRFIREKDGAVWLARGGTETPDREAPETDGEKDEWVIRRRTGQPTYFLADIAYHVDKRRRGFARVIDIWGPDHHGHVARMKTAMEIASRVMPSLAICDDWLEILIAQQVNLIRDGKRVQMSKRAGEYVTLDDLVSEVGADAARFFFLMRRSNSHLDFDLDLAKKTSDENPVYYVQYAHARIASIIEFARTSGFAVPPRGADLGLIASREEIDLVKGLVDFDDVVRASAFALEPHRLPTYLLDLAGRFHRFYHNHRVVTEDRPLSEARLSLCWAAAAVLRSALGLVGVSAPRSM